MQFVYSNFVVTRSMRLHVSYGFCLFVFVSSELSTESRVRTISVDNESNTLVRLFFSDVSVECRLCVRIKFSTRIKLYRIRCFNFSIHSKSSRFERSDRRA